MKSISLCQCLCRIGSHFLPTILLLMLDYVIYLRWALAVLQWLCNDEITVNIVAAIAIIFLLIMAFIPPNMELKLGASSSPLLGSSPLLRLPPIPASPTSAFYPFPFFSIFSFPALSLFHSVCRFSGEKYGVFWSTPLTKLSPLFFAGHNVWPPGIGIEVPAYYHWMCV